MNKIRKLDRNEAADVWCQRLELKDQNGNVVDSAESECNFSDGSCEFEEMVVGRFLDRIGVKLNADEYYDFFEKTLFDDKPWTNGTYTITSERWLTDESEPLT